MRSSPRALELIRHFEGFSAVVYRCPAGIPTIGYGHVVRDAAQFTNGITPAVAETLLLGDLRITEMAIGRLITSALNQSQFDALVSFTFNLGAGRLQMSTLLRRVNAGEHAAVSHELMRWVFARGRRLPGLVARRAAESQLYQEK